MAGGYGAAGFGAGFAKGITGSLISARERERDDQRRAEDKAYEVEKFTLQTVFPQLASMAGDQDIDSIMATQFPLHFGGKKGKARLEQIKPFLLGQQGRQPGEMAGQQAGGVGGAGPPGLTAPIAASMPQAAPAPGGPATSAAAGPMAIPPGALPAPFDRPTGGALPLPPGGPQARPGEGAALPAGGATGAAGAMAPVTNGAPADVLASRPAVSPATPAAAPAGPPAGHTFMGIPWPSSEQRATTAATQATEADRIAMNARRKFIGPATEAYGLTPEQQQEYILTGKISPAAQAEPFTLSPGQARYGAAGQEIARAPTDQAPRQPPGAGSFDAQVLRVQSELGRPITAPEVAKARKDWEALNDPAVIGNDDATAAMVASNPTMLQGQTPTFVGSVMRTIAGSPTLRAQFEENRMAPLRTQAQAGLTALDDLLSVTKNPDGTESIALKPGAAGLYEAGIGRARRWYPGSDEATAKASLDQLTSQLIVDMIGTMKAQSITGATAFGQMNLKELGVVETAATVLKGEISRVKAQQELVKLRQKFQQILAPGTPMVAPPPQGAPSPGAGGAVAGPGAGAAPNPVGGPAGVTMRDGLLYVNGVEMPGQR